jgi:DNA ligase-1
LAGASLRLVLRENYDCPLRLVRAVAPEVVLEVAFDTIQKMSRHKSGFALRFPRIVRIREDKLPAEATTLEEVEEL